MKSPAKTGIKQAGRFAPGKSGNPRGRPAGSRPKALAALDALGERAAETIVDALIEKAKGGDGHAAKTILDRVWPPRKGARLQFNLPRIAAAGDLTVAIADIADQTARGEISPDEATMLVGLLEAQRKAIEKNDLAIRLAMLESRLGNK